MSIPAINPTLSPLLMRFVQVGSAGFKRAMTALTDKSAAEKQAAALAGPLLAQMLESGTVPPAQKAAAAQLLSTHAGTLQLLSNAVVHNTHLRKTAGGTAKTASLGSGVDASTLEGHDSAEPSRPRSPVVGARTSVKSAADVNFARNIMALGRTGGGQ